MTSLNEEELVELYGWIDKIPLSRPKKSLVRDFSDGVLVAEIVQHFFPKAVQIHSYPPANKETGKTNNWVYLNSKVLKKKFNLEVSIRDIERIVRCEDMVIQTVLLKLKTKIERAMWEINDQRAKARHYESEKPEADQLVGSTQKGKQGKSMKGGPSPRRQTLRHNCPEPGTSGPRSRLNQYSDNNESVSRPMYEEKYQESLAKEETIKILEAKIKRLEHLIHLKDVRIDDLQYRIETMRPTGLKR